MLYAFLYNIHVTIILFIFITFISLAVINQTVDSNETKTSTIIPMSTMPTDTNTENGSKQLPAGSYLYDSQPTNDTKETKKRRVCLSGM